MEDCSVTEEVAGLIVGQGAYDPQFGHIQEATKLCFSHISEKKCPQKRIKKIMRVQFVNSMKFSLPQFYVMMRITFRVSHIH